MPRSFANWSDFHHHQNQWYHLTIAVTLLPFALLFLEIETGRQSLLEDGPLFWATIMCSLSITLFLSWMVWKKMKLVDVEDKDLDSKVQRYKEVEKRKYGLLCMAGLICFGGLWLTNYFLLIVLFFSVLAQFSFLRPTMDRFFREARLTKSEREQVKSGVLSKAVR